MVEQKLKYMLMVVIYFNTATDKTESARILMCYNFETYTHKINGHI